MDFSAIKKGMIIKNFSELCSILGTNKKTGESKKRLLKELERHCKYEKSKHAYHICKIHKTPLPKIDGRGKGNGSRGNNNVYGNMLEFLLLSQLIKTPLNKQGHIILTKRNILEYANVINKDYFNYKDKTKSLSVSTEISDNVILEFYETSDNVFRKLVLRTLNSLSEKKIISHSPVIMLAKKSGLVVADKKHITEIKNCQAEVMREQGHFEKDDPQSLRGHDKYKFKESVSEKLYDSLGIKYFYNAHLIYVTTEAIDKEINELSTQIKCNNIASARKEVNHIVSERMYKNAVSRNRVAVKELEWDISNKIINIRSDSSYLKFYKTLINRLVI